MSEEHVPLRCIQELDLPDNGFDVKDVIVRYFQDQNNEPWTRKTGVYHPSALSGCKRALFYDRLGITPVPRVKPELRALFRLGHAIHDSWQQILKEVCEDFFPEEVADFEPLSIYGHCDGVFRIKDWILEIKSMGEASFNRLTKAKKDHLEQAHCYMWAFDIPRVQVLYVCRNNGLMKNFKEKFSMDTWSGIVARIAEVDENVNKDEPPPQEISTYTCPGCKFFHICRPNLYG